MKTRYTSTTKQTGFTIVELMIATVVFSVILLVITVGVIHFTSDYYKGINSSATQTAARTVLNDITQAIEFSSGSVSCTKGSGNPCSASGTTGYICAGNQRYDFSLGNELPNAPGYAVRQNTGSANCGPSASQTELLQKNMRLTYLNMTPAAGDTTGRLWTIQVTVAFGDSDLLCDGTVSPATSTHGCATSATPYGAGSNVAGPDIRCKSQTGSQFCAVAALSTTVSRRLSTN